MRPWLDQRDRGPVAAVFALSLLVYAATSFLAARAAGVPVAWLAAFFDGSIYLEIAKSFPLPYAAAGPDYPSHAPGYPALVALAAFSGSAFGSSHWGLPALVASWVPAALSAVVFYGICRDVGARPLWPCALFVLANPRWLSVASTAHAESTAMLFAVASLAAVLRRRPGLAATCLALAMTARYPALLLGLPLAFGLLAAGRAGRVASAAWLAMPLAAFALLELYFRVRIPGFQGLQHTHDAFWQTGLTWPFAEFASAAASRLAGRPVPNFAFSGLWLLFYLGAIGVGLRRERGVLRILPIWVATVVLFHVSLRGDWSVWDFPRLALLAWPAALLVGWRWLGGRLPAAGLALACAGLGGFGLWWATTTVSGAVQWQHRTSPFPAQAIRRLGVDTPQWIDFRAFRAGARSPWPLAPRARRPAPGPVFSAAERDGRRPGPRGRRTRFRG